MDLLHTEKYDEGEQFEKKKEKQPTPPLWVRFHLKAGLQILVFFIVVVIPIFFFIIVIISKLVKLLFYSF